MSSTSTEGPTTMPHDEARVDRALLAIASVVVLGTIMSILDTTVVNVAINTLAAQFHTNLTTIQWVATGYTLALATVIPLTGWIADRVGTKRLYMTSIALFMLFGPVRSRGVGGIDHLLSRAAGPRWRDD